MLWDTDPDKVDIKKHSDYIIKKVFLLGDLEATRWIAKVYGIAKLKEVASNSKEIRPNVKNFYAKFNL